jgi:hypothetical protein
MHCFWKCKKIKQAWSKLAPTKEGMMNVFLVLSAFPIIIVMLFGCFFHYEKMARSTEATSKAPLHTAFPTATDYWHVSTSTESIASSACRTSSSRSGVAAGSCSCSSRSFRNNITWKSCTANDGLRITDTSSTHLADLSTL